MVKNVLLSIILFLLLQTFSYGQDKEGSDVKETTGFYTLKVIKYYDTYFAEWMDFHDMETEDRYAAIECEVYIGDEKKGNIFLVNSWFQDDIKNFPKVGTTFKTEIFDLEQYYAPTQNYNVNFSDIKIIEEPYLNDQETMEKELKYFTNWQSRFDTMLDRLKNEPNVTVDYVDLGNGLTDSEIEDFEQKLGHPVPAAVREFYQLHGYVQLVWHFNEPFIPKKRVYKDNESDILHSGEFQGTINIVPLERVFFMLYEQKGDDYKIFDYYSRFHMLAFDLNNDDDPTVYLGEEDGVAWRNTGQTFSSYINLVPGIFGYTNRFLDLDLWTLEEEGSILKNENWKKAESDFISLDFSNKMADLNFLK